MVFDIHDLPDSVLAFLAEQHLATLTTQQWDGGPQVTPVGVTYDSPMALARVITWADSYKARTIGRSPGQPVALCQVDGSRWLTLYGTATLRDDDDRVAEAVARYRDRYRPPTQRDDRVVIEIAVDRIVGTVG